VVHLRRPDVRAHLAGRVLAPHDFGLGLPQAVERTGAAQFDPVALG
jgi:hypothetical protein